MIRSNQCKFLMNLIWYDFIKPISYLYWFDLVWSFHWIWTNINQYQHISMQISTNIYQYQTHINPYQPISDTYQNVWHWLFELIWCDHIKTVFELKRSKMIMSIHNQIPTDSIWYDQFQIKHKLIWHDQINLVRRMIWPRMTWSKLNQSSIDLTWSYQNTFYLFLCWYDTYMIWSSQTQTDLIWSIHIFRFDILFWPIIDMVRPIWYWFDRINL